MCNAYAVPDSQCNSFKSTGCSQPHSTVPNVLGDSLLGMQSLSWGIWVLGCYVWGSGIELGLRILRTGSEIFLLTRAHSVSQLFSFQAPMSCCSPEARSLRFEGFKLSFGSCFVGPDKQLPCHQNPSAWQLQRRSSCPSQSQPFRRHLGFTCRTDGLNAV